MSFFEKVPEAPADVIFGLNVAFKADPSPEKVNLVVGAYRTEEGKPLVLNSVKKVHLYFLRNLTCKKGRTNHT